MSIFDDFRDALRNEIVNTTIDSRSRWAEKRRVMGKPFEGPYTFKYHPWCRGLHDSNAVYNVSMKSAQAGFTEVGINIALHAIDIKREAVLYVLPTSGDASDFANTRFNPALSHSPYLKSIFTSTDNVRLKMAGNVPLYIRGSKGDSGLKSLPVSTLILDELDEMDQSQIELALQRLRGQEEKTVWFISTPTIPTHGVSIEYELSTKEHFRFKCPGCNRIDELRFPDSVRIRGDSINDPNCKLSTYGCTMCNFEFHQEEITLKTGAKFVRQDEKLATLTKGFWEKTVVTPVDDQRRGFKINQLYSYTASPGEIVIDYYKSLMNSFANQEFHKSVLGEPFVEDRAQVTDDMLSEAAKDYNLQQLTVQAGSGKFVTLGIDRGATCYYVVLEWEIGLTGIDLNECSKPRMLDCGIFAEDDFISQSSRLMHQWQVLGCMVDADPGTTEARRFARMFPGFVWLNRYRSGVTGKQVSVQDDGSYAPVVTVDRTAWLDISLGRFYSKTIEIPKDTPTTFKEHVKNLVRLYKKDQFNNPVAYYENFEKPDHFGHALNYAEIALPFARSVQQNSNVEAFL